MLITAKSDYGLRAALHLSRSGSRQTVHQIAQAQRIPEKLCAQIMRRLVNKGIARSKAGREGGYSLAREARLISVASVLEAADRGVCIFKCVGNPGICEFSENCTLRAALGSFADAIGCYLEKLSVEDMKQGKPALPAFAAASAQAPAQVAEGVSA
ncbi:MAG: Rrf2 family transcriptional regulator [Planctomycetes bacterium]|nr:Rrf2 family transcriptional regulator [Planctomycetota bacterium]